MKNQPFARRLTFALRGLRTAVIGEASFRFQTFAAAGALAVLAVLRAAPVWWAVFSTAIGLVLTAEMLNTALERWIDHTHPERDPAIAAAKDCAAGAVLVASLVSLGVFAAFLFAEFSAKL